MAVPRPGGKLRAVMLLGFGGLFLLLIVAGWQALTAVGQLRTQEQAARSAFLARNQALIEFSSGLDEYGNRVDQYFLSYGPGTPHDAARDLNSLFVQVRTALDHYPPDRAPEEQALLASLYTLLAAQQQTLTTALADYPPPQTRAKPDAMTQLLYGEILPGSQQLSATARKVAVWNHNQYANRGAALLDSFSAVRTHLTRLLVVILGCGFLLAAGSFLYIATQDREARQRYAELAESRNALSQLSARLLDAQEEERRSISRELHDEVGQSLGALLVDVGRLSTQLPANPALQDQLERMKALAERSVHSVRNMALLLRPSMLDDLGLMPAVEWQGREISRRSDLEVEISSDGISDELPEDYKTCIYRLTQEALNNAARHSGGHHAWVNIEQQSGRIALSIRDDGHGFDPQRARGLGLLGMEERVRRLGGTLHVDSHPGTGATIRAELPLLQKRAA